jgi:hypothetical protein
MKCVRRPAKLRKVAGAFALLALLLQVGFGQQSQATPETSRTVAQAVSLLEQTFVSEARETPIARQRRLAAAARSFAATLDALAHQTAPGLCAQMKAAEGRDIETKLVAIACDRKERAEAYREIERVYVKGVHSIKSEFPRSPELKDVHVTENYRLPWEFYLLTPPSEDASPLYDFRAAEAIGLIRDNASIVTLLFAFRITTLKGVNPKRVEDRQTQILNALNNFTNEPALRAMLECLTLSLQQPGGPAWDVRDYIYRLLTDQEGFGNGDVWRRVITAFPRDGLPLDQQKLLQGVLSAGTRA